MEFLEAVATTAGAFVRAWSFFLDPVFVGFMFGGLIIGIIVGILPGIGSLIGVAVFLPFVFFLTPREALPFMLGLMAVAFMGGSITTILLGVPGTSSNTPTLMDGFPMAKKGEAGRALGAAITASGMGSIYTAAFAILMVPLVIPLILWLTSAEMVFIILLGVTMIAVLSRGSMLKGLISGFLGLMVSLIGYHVVTGVTRFTFGSTYLYDGLSLTAVTLGVFAVPEMIKLMVTGGTIAQQAAKIKGMKGVWQGARDVFRHWRLNLRCSVIGYFVGVIPGVGSLVASWVAYGHAKQISKYPELFGTGIVDGVIAPESANDAKEGGALLTTLALGIPGSSIMVLLMGAFIMLGLVPGPEMLTKHLDLSLGMVLVIAVASVIGAVICFTLAPHLARVAYVPGRILVPLVLVIVFLGTFVAKGLLPDLFVVVIFGGLGLLMDRLGYNKPAFILGFVLGALFEKYLFISLMAWGDLFFLRPGSLGLLIVIVAFLAFDPIKNWFGRRSKRGDSKA